MITLDEDTSRHIAQVLRMQAGEQLVLTNGKGVRLITTIENAHKKHCIVRVDGSEITDAPVRKLTMAVALLKNTSRIEWFLEKATEMGVHRIVMMHTHRTVKEKFRRDRMMGILISAMLQSQQTWLPELIDPVTPAVLFQQAFLKDIQHRYIAHCLPLQRNSWLQEELSKQDNTILMIGPEGDFTPEEIDSALAEKFIPVMLGNNRLRTETAAMAAVAGYYLSQD